MRMEGTGYVEKKKKQRAKSKGSKCEGNIKVRENMLIKRRKLVRMEATGN